MNTQKYEVRPSRVYRDGQVVGYIPMIFGPNFGQFIGILGPALAGYSVHLGMGPTFKTPEEAMTAWEQAIPCEITQSQASIPVRTLDNIKALGLFRKMDIS